MNYLENDNVDLLSVHEVLAKVGVSMPTLHRMRERGDFPEPLVLAANSNGSPRSIAWRADVIDAWQATRTVATQGEIFAAPAGPHIVAAPAFNRARDAEAFARGINARIHAVNVRSYVVWIESRGAERDARTCAHLAQQRPGFTFELRG